MKRLIAYFIGMTSLLGLNAQKVSGLDIDTVYCITINYFYNDHREPQTYTFLLPVHDTCYVNLSSHDTLIESLNHGTYPISDFFFSLFPMIEASFPDSSFTFRKESYNNSISKWLYYNIKNGNSKELYTKTDDVFIITIAKIMAIMKHNVNGFPLAISIIKDIVPVSLSDNCIKDDIMVLSKIVLHEI